ncbi:hypothetical protein MLD38_008355 [Melastoma candidum]|uniref:Uncharacterized protein n=1 Tax=Melastoma candidum TaxID=119954 RepID=A0ACB9RTI5_9MYRT|nr:hypothetical protein MLD38_008355 [Melastoma candidum]
MPPFAPSLLPWPPSSYTGVVHKEDMKITHVQVKLMSQHDQCMRIGRLPDGWQDIGLYGFFVFGQFVAGVGIAFALVIAPVYTAEAASLDVSNVVFSKLPLYLGWQFMLGIVVIHSVFLTIVAMGMPESPHWLMLLWGLSGVKCFLRDTLDSLDEAEQRLADLWHWCSGALQPEET